MNIKKNEENDLKMANSGSQSMLDWTVLEYSKSQGDFCRTQTLRELLAGNLNATIDNSNASRDYIPIGIFETFEQLVDAQKLIERAMMK